MNNKKLFKGALVLFASILMAVSCQSNSNPNDNNDSNSNNNNNNTTTKTDLDVTITPSEVQNIKQTTTKWELKSTSGWETSKNTLQLTVSGNDLDKVKDVTVKSIVGLNTTEIADANSTTMSGLSSKVDFSTLNTKLKTDMITISGQVTSTTLTAADTLSAQLRTVATSTSHGGVIKVTVVLNPKDDETKNAKEVTLFIVIKGNS